jgi:oligoendopeptidase F
VIDHPLRHAVHQVQVYNRSRVRALSEELEAVECNSMMNHRLHIHLILYAQVIARVL